MPIRMPAHKAPASLSQLALTPAEIDSAITEAKRFFQAAKAPSIHPVIAQALAPFAPASSNVHAQASEAELIAADLAYNRMKETGEIWSRETARAAAEELKWSQS